MSKRAASSSCLAVHRVLFAFKAIHVAGRKEERRDAVLDQISTAPNAVLADLQARLTDWRSLLSENIPKARGLVKQLIVGRLEMIPDHEKRLYRFRGTGTLV